MGVAWKEGGAPHCTPFHCQLEELRQQLELQEEELGRLRLGVVSLPARAQGGDRREARSLR